MRTTGRAARAFVGCACAALITACGGGGGGGGGGSSAAPAPTTPQVTAPVVADSRNGSYQLFATDGFEYTLAIDVNAGTYKLTGNGLDTTGAFSGSTFDVQPGTNPPPRAPGLSYRNDVLVGTYRFPSGVLPFIAARSFVTSATEAAGAYNFLAREIDPASPGNTEIFSGEVLAAGTLRTCNDSTVYKIALCPSTSVITGTVTANGSQFTSVGSSGTIPFRVARMGTDLVLLRASAGPSGSRRFWIGLKETGTNPPLGDYDGVNTIGQWTTSSYSSTGYNGNWADNQGNTIRLGTVSLATSTAISPMGVASVDMSSDGRLFTMRTDQLGVMSAARGNATLPGYYEIGLRRQ